MMMIDLPLMKNLFRILNPRKTISTCGKTKKHKKHKIKNYLPPRHPKW